MAAQSSLKRIINYSGVLSKHCRRQGVLICILCSFEVLFSLFHFVAFRSLTGTYSDFYSYSRVFAAAAALAGVLIVPAVFRELYNRQFADVEYSLPMSASERFCSKLLTLMKNHLLPFAAAQVTVLIVGLVMLPGGQRIIVVHDFLTNLINLVFTDAAALFCVSCCGSLAECIYTPLFAAFALSVIVPLCFTKFVIMLSGRVIEPIMMGDFPLGYPMVTYIVMNGDLELTDYSELMSTGTGAVVFRLCLNLAVSAVIGFLAFRVYKKRSGLDTGRPMAFRWFRIGFTLLMTLTVIVMFFLNSFYLSILVGVLVFLGINISAKRARLAMRDLAFWLTGFAGCLASVLTVGFVSYLTGGFGYEKSAVSSAFEGDSAAINVYLIDGKHEYNTWLAARKNRTAEYFNTLPDTAFADKARINQAVSEVADMDPRYDLSFTEKLSAYMDTVRYERNNRDSIYGDDWRPGDIIVSVRCVEDDYRAPEYYDQLKIRVSTDEVRQYLETLRSRGFVVEEYRYEPYMEEDYMYEEEQPDPEQEDASQEDASQEDASLKE